MIAKLWSDFKFWATHNRAEVVFLVSLIIVGLIALCRACRL